MKKPKLHVKKFLSTDCATEIFNCTTCATRRERISIRQCAFRRGHIFLARVKSHSLTQSAGRTFEHCLGDVMTVLAVMQDEMQIHQRIGGCGLPEDVDQVGVEFADLARRNDNFVNEPGPAAEID